MTTARPERRHWRRRYRLNRRAPPSDFLRTPTSRFGIGLAIHWEANQSLALLDAQRSLASADDALAASHARLATDQVAIFLALGGGWE